MGRQHGVRIIPQRTHFAKDVRKVHNVLNIKCLTAHCQFWSLVAARLLVLGVRHGGLKVDRLTAPGFVHAGLVCYLFLGHYSVDF